MKFPTKHIRKDFHGSRFWVPSLTWSSQVIKRRRYRILHEGSNITIERTFNDVFDLLLARESFKRCCLIAKGKIEWQENNASLNLEIQLLHFMKVLIIILMAFTAMLVFYLFYVDWKLGIIFSLCMALVWSILAWSTSFGFNEFHSELERDIEYFKTEKE